MPTMDRAACVVAVVALVTAAGVWRPVSGQGSSPVQYSVLEEQPRRTFIGNLKQDANLSQYYTEYELSQLRFTPRSASGPSYAMFSVTEATGDVWTNEQLDREEVCPYSETCDVEIDIKITPFAYFRIIKLIIFILDTNDHAPEFPSKRMSLDIMENVRPRARFSLPAAEDTDSGELGVYRYELISDVDKFQLEETDHLDGSKDVSLVLVEELDREEETFYSVTVVAWDRGSPPKSGSLVVDISVTDFNDNSPEFEKYLYTVQIYENLPQQTPILQVRATDPDSGPNGVVRYAFTTHTESTYGSIFGIRNSTGEVYIKGVVDFEQERLFLLNVEATDLGLNSRPAFAKVTIEVLDTNDHAPEIVVTTFTNRDNAEVPENAESGQFVAHVAVTDPDMESNGEYHCSIDNGNFFLEPIANGYKIITTAVFDREEMAEHQILLKCTDHGSPQRASSKLINVEVSDENDNSPVFLLPPGEESYDIHFRENNSYGAFILKVNASDADVGRNAALKYEIRGIDGTKSETVNMDLITGVVRASVLFDFERQEVYNYMITATDRGEPSRKAEVPLRMFLIDINDEFPTFTLSSYSFTVMENQAAFQSVGVVKARDKDAAPFNNISYSLQPNDAKAVGKFSIDSQTGELTTNQILDREECATYRLTVVAMNVGFPSILRMVNLTVHVSDENDNPPLIEFPNKYNNTVQTSTRVDEGVVVTQIHALDVDEGNNSQLTYEITNGNDDGNYVIDPLTGAIAAAVYIESPNLRRQKLVVTVRDHGDPRQFTIASLNILYNKSVPLSSAQTGTLLAAPNMIIVIGICAGVVFIVVIVTLAVCCARARHRLKLRKQMYNCRIQEVQKSIANGEMQQRDRRSNGSGSGTGTASEASSEGSIENCHLAKTKDRGPKKEVTFSLDMDDAYIDKIPSTWPLQETKIIEAYIRKVLANASGENPHAGAEEVVASSPSVMASKMGRLPHDRGKPHYPGHHHPADRPPRHHRHRGAAAMLDAANRGQHFTHEDLQMHDMLAGGDRDSESGCSGTDSGRGPSEEGDHLYATQLEPFLPRADRKECGSPIGSASSLVTPGIPGVGMEAGEADLASTHNNNNNRVPGSPSHLSPTPLDDMCRTTPITAALRSYEQQRPAPGSGYRHFEPALPRVPEGCPPPASREAAARLGAPHKLPRHYSDCVHAPAARGRFDTSDDVNAPKRRSYEDVHYDRQGSGTGLDHLRVSDQPTRARYGYLPPGAPGPKGAPNGPPHPPPYATRAQSPDTLSDDGTATTTSGSYAMDYGQGRARSRDPTSPWVEIPAPGDIYV